MGIEKIGNAVTDAGPLIHLTEINCLRLLGLFRALYITNAVWLETVKHGRIKEADLIGIGNVHRYDLSQIHMAKFTQEYKLQHLHAGEAESLCLCLEIGMPTIITDDLVARDVAKRLKLTPVGSLGIVVKAYRIGNISLAEAQHYITALYEVSSLFVTKVIVDMAIEQLHRHFN